jgi:hypothetical protein
VKLLRSFSVRAQKNVVYLNGYATCANIIVIGYCSYDKDKLKEYTAGIFLFVYIPSLRESLPKGRCIFVISCYMGRGRKRSLIMKIRLVLCLVLSVVATAAFAQTEADFGVTLNDAGDGVVITKYTGKTLAVRIPATLQGVPVKEIGKNAFSRHNGTGGITSAVIPAGVTKIEERAFYSQQKLASVTIPDSVAVIGAEAFYECSALTGIALPKNLTVIEKDTFARCENLASVTMPEGLTEIRGSDFFGAFGSCYKLASIKIPNSVTVIGSRAFKNCSVLASVTLGTGIDVIGKNAFENCPALTVVTIPATVEIIGGIGMAFTNCPKLNLATQALIKKLTGKQDELLAGNWNLAEGQGDTNIRYMNLRIDGTGSAGRDYNINSATWESGNGRFYLTVEYSSSIYSGTYNVSEQPHTITLTENGVNILKYEKRDGKVSDDDDDGDDDDW